MVVSVIAAQPQEKKTLEESTRTLLRDFDPSTLTTLTRASSHGLLQSITSQDHGYGYILPGQKELCEPMQSSASADIIHPVILSDTSHCDEDDQETSNYQPLLVDDTEQPQNTYQGLSVEPEEDRYEDVTEIQKVRCLM